MLEISGYGRIASDISVKKDRNDKHLYTNFLLASHDRKKDTTFIRCVAFDAMAALLHDYFSRGDRIIVKGNLVSDDYKGSKFVFKIIIREFEFVETKAEHEKNREKHTRKEKENNQE